MNFEAVIGLEIHVQMKTKSKMFSSAPVSFENEPNTNIAPFDMAFPGTMPTVNKQAVINAIRVANALHMMIDNTLCFDRKNYFYSDLPKGFQITQQTRPIGKDGYVFVSMQNGEKRIGIERLHIEEDTCKQEHFADYTLLDYNRAGVPLIEIVSKPEISNGVEAKQYVEAIRNIVLYSETSDGKMEEGSLRVDTNVSVRPIGSKELGTKVEIKNLNSLKNLQISIDYEIKRQIEVILSGGKVEQETRRFDEAKRKTVLMRAKTDEIDYKYIPEPNIPPIKLSDDFIKNAIDTGQELYDSKLKRYMEAGLQKTNAEIILSNPKMAKYFEIGMKIVKNAKDFADFMIVEINRYLNKNNIEIEDFPIKAEDVGQIILMQEIDGLSHKQCIDIFEKVIADRISPLEAKKELKIETQISDSHAIMEYIHKTLDANPRSIADFKSGKDRALSFLVGQVIKISKGKTNASEVYRLIKEELEKR